MIDKWNLIATLLNHMRIAIVVFVSTFGILGLSVMGAAVNDVLFLCCIWLLAIYYVVARIYNYTLKMMQTLFRLFRGKKFNVLRNRDDANNFSVSELYLGVLIITLSIFLLPTVAMFYYYVFISIILNVLALQLALIAAQTLITDFPYFLVFIAFFRPYILPNSIRMHIDKNGKGI